MTALSLFIEVALKATLLLAAAGVAAFALRGAAASLRHLLWSWSLVGMLALPALTLVLPRWQLGLLALPESSTTSMLPIPAIDEPVLTNVRTDARDRVIAQSPLAVPTRFASTPSPARHTPRDWTASLILVWLGGLIAALITVAGGLVTLRRVARKSSELTDQKWLALAGETMATLGIVRPVRIIISESASMPATWGVVRPTVLLPADAQSWDDERRRVVLLHELAHVQRHDFLMQVVAQICCAVYWFHPGVWYTARKLRSERELACDEQVLDVGINACDYAAHLLEIATRFRAPLHTSIAAVAMARPSQLEGRLVAILSENATRRFKATARVKAVALSSIFALSLPLAAMRPWKAGPESASGIAANAPAVPSGIGAMRAPGDTFRWKGVVPAGKWVEIFAAYSDMEAELSRTGEVEIIAVRKTGAPGSFRVVMQNPGGAAKFCVVGVASRNQSRRCEDDVDAGFPNGVGATRVDFLIRLPAGVGLAAHTGRGNIAAADVESYVWATSRQGDIDIVTTDLAEASTTNGDISAVFGRRSWRQDLEFLSDRGDVTVVAPVDANMLIQAEGSLGQVTSEFPGTMARFGSGQRFTGRNGNARGMLTLRTGRGRAELKRGSRAVAENSSIGVGDSDAPSTGVDPKPNANPDANSDYNPDPGYNPNPNPNPSYNPDENPIPEIDEAEAARQGLTGEKLPVSVPSGLVARFNDAAIRGWPDARPIQRLRDVAATHVKQHANDYVRERSEWALTLVRNGELFAPVRTALASSDWRERAYAAWVLGAMQDRRAIDPLTTALGDPHWRVRMHAASGLERIGGAQTVPQLITALNDPVWQVRIAAVDALAAIGDKRAVASLEAVASSDPRSVVRDEAQNAIQRLR